MANHNFPQLDASALVESREACHAYTGVLGGWATSCRQRRNHRRKPLADALTYRPCGTSYSTPGENTCSNIPRGNSRDV
jgi:hypothetical protein